MDAFPQWGQPAAQEVSDHHQRGESRPTQIFDAVQYWAQAGILRGSELLDPFVGLRR